MLNTFQRYENKYLINDNSYRALMEDLHMHMKPDKFCKNDQFYTINNIYYDTQNHDIIRHSLAKPYYKHKLRLRSYAVPKDYDEPVYLELKKKIGKVVSKRRATMSLGEAYEFMKTGKRPGNEEYLNNQVIDEITGFSDCHKLEPRVLISYERIAFFGKADKDLRITFDSNIKTRRDELFLESGSFGTNLLTDDQYLMEIKIPGAIPLWLTHALARLHIYSTSFSKYGAEYKSYCQKSPAKIFAFPHTSSFTSCVLRPEAAVN